MRLMLARAPRAEPQEIKNITEGMGIMTVGEEMTPVGQ